MVYALLTSRCSEGMCSVFPNSSTELALSTLTASENEKGTTGGPSTSNTAPPSPPSPCTEQDMLPKGLIVWREAVIKAQTAAQLAMAFYMLEASIAWDKSIMKAVSATSNAVSVGIALTSPHSTLPSATQRDDNTSILLFIAL
jgi:hypothetical protein